MEKKDGPWRQLKSFKSAFDRACRHANLSEATPYRMEVVEKIANYSPSIFTTPKMAEPATPYAPVAQVDRATVS
jgi:hypothetical protein